VVRAAFVLVLLGACGGAERPVQAPRDLDRAPASRTRYAPWPVLVGAAYPSVAVDESFPASPPRELAPIAAQLQRGELAAGAVALEAWIESPSAPQLVPLARYWLARALYRLGYAQSALAELDLLSQSLSEAQQPIPPEAQDWLLKLILETSDRFDLAGRLGEVGVSASDARRFALGRYHLLQGEHARAEEALAPIADGSPFFLRATLVRAENAVYALELGRAAPLFRTIAERSASNEDEEQLVQHARLALAQLYFQRGVGYPPSARATVNAAILFERVDPDSLYGPDAALGRAWTLFRMYRGNSPAVLEALEGVPDAYVAAMPEIAVLEALVLYITERIDDAEATAARNSAVFETRAQAVEQTFAAYADNAELVRASLPWLRGVSDPAPKLAGLAWRCRAARENAQSIRALDRLVEQQHRFDAAEPALRSSALGARIAQDLAIATSFETDQLGDRLRGAAVRWVEEMEQRRGELRTIRDELQAYRAGALNADR
jgi:hypothetical protein